MNRRMVLSVTGKILQVEALLLLFPAVVALCYNEFKSVFSFVAASLAAFTVGTIICLLFKPRSNVIYAREGLIIVALGWIAMSLFGCLPFVIGENIAFVDAFFETVSGFTTTGSSVLRNVEALSHGTLLWRSFTHWIGGMGVLVFITAIIPNMSDRSIHIIRAEMPGPIIGKLVPKIKDTSRVLYLIYVVMTLTETVFLLFGGLD